MPEESILKPEEGLALIQEVIARSKEQYRHNSFYFMLWGWLMSIASFGFFILRHYTSFAYFYLPFPILSATGILASVLHYLRERGQRRVESYTDFFFSRLWMVMCMGFIAIVIVSVSQKLPPFLFVLVIAGIGTLLSGMVMRFKPLVFGGTLFFTTAIAGIFVPNELKPLLLALAIIAGLLLPGYLLKHREQE